MEDLKFKKYSEKEQDDIFSGFGTDGELIQSIFVDCIDIVEDCCSKILPKLVSLGPFQSKENLFKNNKFSLCLTLSINLITNFLLNLTCLNERQAVDLSKKIMEQSSKNLSNKRIKDI